MSTGYRPGLKNWECFECYKRLLFLMIISLFEKNPQNGVVFLILVTCMSTLVLSRASPFNNSLINGGHVCTDLLLLTILLSSVLHNSIRDSTATNADVPFATFVFIFFCLVWPAMGVVLAVEVLTTKMDHAGAQSIWHHFLYTDGEHGGKGLRATLGRNIRRVSRRILSDDNGDGLVGLNAIVPTPAASSPATPSTIATAPASRGDAVEQNKAATPTLADDASDGGPDSVVRLASFSRVSYRYRAAQY